jgi:hypothetical protein
VTFKVAVENEYLTVWCAIVEHSSGLFMYVINMCIMGTKRFAAVVSSTAGNRTNLAVSHATHSYYPRQVKCFRKETGHLTAAEILATG